jgi:hypothetical protein
LAQTIEFLLINEFDLVNLGYNEDSGVCYNNDKDLALKMLPNLINIIKQEEKINNPTLTSLNEIINVEYKSRTMTYRLNYLFNLYKIN